MRRLSCVVLAISLVTIMGCSSGQPDLVIYSGRSMALVDSLVMKFEEETGINAEVRYGKDAQLLAAIQEEGSGSPADVYWANTVGALASARESNLLASLPDSVMSRPGAFRPSHDKWVPVTARFRVLAYNEDVVDTTALPSSVLDLPDLEQFEGRIGWTPTYSSFQDFLTAMRHVHGRDTTRSWLNAMQELNPKAYPSNTPMIQALAAGEIDIGLTNHYYVLRTKYGGGEGGYEGENQARIDPEAGAKSGGSDGSVFRFASVGEAEGGVSGPQVPVEMYHFRSGDVGNLALVTGAAMLQTTDQRRRALRFLSFLHSRQAQLFAAQQVNEYPVVGNADVPHYMVPVEEALRWSPQFDFERLRDLDATLALMREVGII